MTRPLLPYALCILGLIGLGGAASGCHRNEDGGASSFPRDETLYLGGLQWGEPTTFNPLATEPAWPVPWGESNYNLIYEPLLLFNSETGKMQPLLGDLQSVTDDAIEVILNPAARWSDGKPVTGWDVKYTFELGKTYKGLRVSPRWAYLKEVRLKDEGASPYPRDIVFVLEPERKNPLVVLDTLQETAILPKHIIEPALAQMHGDLDEFTKSLKFDQNPVGSGPYHLHTYSSEKIVLVRNDDYWGNAAHHGGKRAAPKYLIEPIYKSNDAFSVALQQGRIDASLCYVPRIWLKQKKGVHSWYEKEPFFVSASIPMLIPNVTHAPLNDVVIRRAMAYAINYKDIRELAVSGYSEALQPGLVLPFGLEAKYFFEEDAKKYGASFDPARAKQLLKDAGYVSIYDDKGELVEMRDKDGHPQPTIYVKSPTGWTDWESITRIAVKSMRDVGIDAREKFVDSNLYWPASLTGDFDLILYQPTPAPTPSQPWTRFDAIMSSREWTPNGEKTFKNYGRFNKPGSPDYIPRIDALLQEIPTIHDEKALVAAYRELNVLFMQAQVTLPLVYRPDSFFEVSVRHWDNFPSANNPYVPPQMPGDRLGTEMLWSVRPAGSASGKSGTTARAQ